jgi:hypothetical protein
MATGRQTPFVGAINNVEILFKVLRGLFCSIKLSVLFNTCMSDENFPQAELKKLKINAS